MEEKKKSGGAGEREEFSRGGLRVMIAPATRPERLVFVEETRTNASLAPLYAWSRRGERTRFEVTRNWGANVTLLASVRGMGPCLALEGPTTKAVFEAYLERVLAPSLGL